MKKYIIKQNKMRPVVVMGCLALIGVALLFSGSFGIPFASLLQLVGVGFLVAAVSIFTGSTVTGGVVVAIDDRPDEISAYPKLYIYTTKGKHNITGMNMIIKFTDIRTLREGPRKSLIKEKVGVRRDCIYANFMPERVYSIKYEVYGGIYEVLCDFGPEVAEQIAIRIEKYSGLEEYEE